jgi:prepilin-type N-terminal cleavage/methylation domain-containing protein
MNNRQLKMEKAFTLIELLVVIAIVGILAGLAVVSMSGATDSARLAKTKVFSASARDSLLSSRVSEWTMDEGGGNAISDYWGANSCDLTGHAPDWAATTSCVSGSCLDFSGSNKFVSCADSSSLNFGTNSFTIEMWGKYRDFTYPKAWFMIKKSAVCYSGAGNPGWDVGHGYAASGLFVCYNDGVNNIGNAFITFNSDSRPSVFLNQWTNLFIVFDKGSNRIKAYVNGRKQDSEVDISDVTGSVNNSSPLSIGTMYGWITDGYVDQVRVYNQALTLSQVRFDYLAGLENLLSAGKITREEYQQKISKLNSDYAVEE